MLDTTLYRADVSLIVGAVDVLMLSGLVRLIFRRARLSLWWPLLAGFAVRLIAIGIVAAIPSIAAKLASTDEATFLLTTKMLVALPLTNSAWPGAAVHLTEVIPWALTMKLFGQCGDVPLRLEQVGLQLVAVALFAWAASILGGRRAGLIAAWIGALEPSNVFISTLIHHEPLFMIGEALVLIAGARIWVSGPSRTDGLVALAGIAIVFGTRQYIAFFVGVAIGLELLCVALRPRWGEGRAIGLTLAVALACCGIGVLAAPHVVPGELGILQGQLNYRYAGASLELPPATVTTSSGLVTTAITRSVDLLLRPYPWQLASSAQKVAAGGTLLWYAMVVVLIGLCVSRRRDLTRLAPVAALVACVVVGFALTLVDTGEGFRHRTSVILMLSVAVGVLADRWLSSRSAARPVPA